MSGRFRQGSLRSRAPIRVLYLQPCASFGGAERQASIVIPRMKEWDIEVIPLVGPSRTIVRWLEDHGVSETVLSTDFPGNWRKPRGLGRLSLPYRYLRCKQQLGAEVERLILELGVDLVYAAMPFSWVAATPPARKHGVPIVWRAGGTLIRPVEKVILRSWARMNPPDLLLCCSEAVREVFGPLTPAPTEVVRNGVELDRFRPGRGEPNLFRPPGARLVVGFAARLAPEKRPEDFVEMAARLAPQFPDAVFLVAGEGSRRPQYQALAEERGLTLGRQIQFLGYVEDMASFYAACDILTLPSRSEGCPNMVLEAMAMQKALAVTNLVAKTGVIAHERDGLIFQVGDVDDFTAQVGRLLSSEPLRAAVARRAFYIVRREHDVRASARRISRVLHTTVALSGRRALPLPLRVATK
jgi:glycosyltransferase involved in cell wall biosynthesis